MNVVKLHLTSPSFNTFVGPGNEYGFHGTCTQIPQEVILNYQQVAANVVFNLTSHYEYPYEKARRMPSTNPSSSNFPSVSANPSDATSSIPSTGPSSSPSLSVNPSITSSSVPSTAATLTPTADSTIPFSPRGYVFVPHTNNELSATEVAPLLSESTKSSLLSMLSLFNPLSYFYITCLHQTEAMYADPNFVEILLENEENVPTFGPGIGLVSSQTIRNYTWVRKLSTNGGLFFWPNGSSNAYFNPPYVHNRSKMLDNVQKGVAGYTTQSLVLHPETRIHHGGSLGRDIPEYVYQGVRLWADAATGAMQEKNAEAGRVLLVMPRVEDAGVVFGIAVKFKSLGVEVVPSGLAVDRLPAVLKKKSVGSGVIAKQILAAAEVGCLYSRERGAQFTDNGVLSDLLDSLTSTEISEIMNAAHLVVEEGKSMSDDPLQWARFLRIPMRETGGASWFGSSKNRELRFETWGSQTEQYIANEYKNILPYGGMRESYLGNSNKASSKPSFRGKENNPSDIMLKRSMGSGPGPDDYFPTVEEVKQYNMWMKFDYQYGLEPSGDFNIQCLDSWYLGSTWSAITKVLPMIKNGQKANFFPTRWFIAEEATEVPYPPGSKVTRSGGLSHAYSQGMASGIATLATGGRSFVGDQPAYNLSSDAWQKWHARRTGYVLAWRLATLKLNPPFLEVKPTSNVESDCLPFGTTPTPGTQGSATVRFLEPPQADVTINIKVEDYSQEDAVAIIPQQIFFTKFNYSNTVHVYVVTSGKVKKGTEVEISFEAVSDDECVDGVSDTWKFTTMDQPQPSRNPTVTITPSKSKAPSSSPISSLSAKPSGATSAVPSNTRSLSPSNSLSTKPSGTTSSTPSTSHSSSPSNSFIPSNGHSFSPSSMSAKPSDATSAIPSTSSSDSPSTSPTPFTCNTKNDCDDKDFCTRNKCSKKKKCLFKPIKKCCHKESDCDDSNICTKNWCNAKNKCRSKKIRSCKCVTPEGKCKANKPCCNDSLVCINKKCVVPPSGSPSNKSSLIPSNKSSTTPSNKSSAFPSKDPSFSSSENPSILSSHNPTSAKSSVPSRMHSTVPSQEPSLAEEKTDCLSRINHHRSKVGLVPMTERTDLHSCVNRQSEYDSKPGVRPHASALKCGGQGSTGQGNGNNCAAVIDMFYNERWSCVTSSLFNVPFKKLNLPNIRECRQACLDNVMCLSYDHDGEEEDSCRFYDELSEAKGQLIDGTRWIGGIELSDETPAKVDGWNNVILDVDGANHMPTDGVITGFKWYGSNTNGVHLQVYRTVSLNIYELVGQFFAPSTIIGEENSLPVAPPMSVNKGDMIGFLWSGGKPAFGFSEGGGNVAFKYDKNSGGPTNVGEQVTLDTLISRRYHFSASFVPNNPDDISLGAPRNYCAAKVCGGHCGPVMGSTTTVMAWGVYNSKYTLNWRPHGTMPMGGSTCPSGIEAVKCSTDPASGTLWAYGVGGEDCHSTCSLAGATPSDLKCDVASPITGGFDQVSNIMSNFENPYNQNDADEFTCTTGRCGNTSNTHIKIHEYNSNCYAPANTETYSCDSWRGNSNCLGQRFNQLCPCKAGCTITGDPECNKFSHVGSTPFHVEGTRS